MYELFCTYIQHSLTTWQNPLLHQKFLVGLITTILCCMVVPRLKLTSSSGSKTPCLLPLHTFCLTLQLSSFIIFTDYLLIFENILKLQNCLTSFLHIINLPTLSGVVHLYNQPRTRHSGSLYLLDTPRVSTEFGAQALQRCICFCL
jgi:hypothetical protein